MRRRWLAAMSLALVVLAALLHAPPADAATPRRQVVLALVPESSWALVPPALFDGWARASLAVASASGGDRIGDSYLTVSKGGRSSGLGIEYGTGPMALDGDRLTFLDWKRFVDHDDDLKFGGHIGALGQAVAGAGVSATVITRTNTAAAFVLADRSGVVRHAILGGGASDVANEVARGTQLVVAETSVDALPIVVRAAGDACVVVASVTFPRDRADLGVVATSPACGLGAGSLVSASTRQPGYVVLADLMPTTLELLGVDRHEADEAAPIRAAGGSPSVAHLIEVDRRSAVTGNAEGWFEALVVAGALGGLFVTLFAGDRGRRRYGAVLLALPVSMLLIDVVPWWRSGTAAGMAMAGALAVGLGLLATRTLGRAPRLLVAALGTMTAVVLAVDASTGGRLELDSVVANNAIGAGRFSGMGNVPYGFFVAACLLAGGVAIDRWGRKAVAPVVVAFVAATIADGAPSLGSDVGGVLSAVPAFALLVVAWRRPLPLRRLLAVALSGVLVLAAFAAVDVSRPVGSRTHLGRTLTNGVAVSTFVRREINALKTFRESPWFAVLLVALVGLYALRSQLPASRPMKVTLAALALAAVLGTFLNDSGVAVAGSMAAVAWPAYLVLVDPAPEPPPQRGGSSRYRRTPSTVPMKR